MTALRLHDTLDIIAADYPDKYRELSNYVEDKRRKEIAAAQAALNAKRKQEHQAQMRAHRAVSFYFKKKTHKYNLFD